MLSEIVGTIGLTASGSAAYYVMTGKFGSTAWMLWIANLGFAGNQIHYVQLPPGSKAFAPSLPMDGPSPSDSAS